MLNGIDAISKITKLRLLKPLFEVSEKGIQVVPIGMENVNQT
jgi:hypothetical protein